MEKICRCLSVVVPAYNEESRLASTLDSILGYLSGASYRWELLVVDDGSDDSTVAVVEAGGHANVRVISLGSNQGKGAAVRRGIIESRGCTILVSDADLSTPIEELEQLRAELAVGPLVIGSRDLPESFLAVPQSRFRRLSGRVFRVVVGLAGVRGIRDSQCGFKLMEGDLGRRIFQVMITDGFAFDVELIWLTQRSGRQVVEVGVTWSDSQGSRVNMVSDPFRMLLQIVRFRWRHRRIDPLFLGAPGVSSLHQHRAD